MGRGVAVPFEVPDPEPELACFAVFAFLSFSFFSVCSPTLPSADSPFAFWKAFTAFSVSLPKSPSMLPV